MARMRVIVGLLLGVGMLAGCGSTVTGVQAGASGAQASSDGLGLGVPAPTAASSSDGGLGQPGLTGAPATGTSASAPTSSVTDNGSVPTITGPVVTSAHAPVQLGVILPSTSAGSAFGDLTGVALNTGDLQGMSTALERWVNAHGGLGGHQANVVYYHRCFNCNVPADDESACTSMTQDNHVVAAIDNTQMSEQLAGCLAHRGAAALGGGVALLDNAALRSARNFYTPYGMSAETTFATLIDRLNASGWLPATDKLGLIVSTADPTFPKLVPYVKARLQAIGRAFTAEAEVAPASSSDAASAVLRFKAAGIKRVVIIGTGSGVELVLGPQEQTQGYHPKITVTSYDVLGTAAGLESKQFWDGAAGIGWMPADDGSSNRPAQNASERLCRSIYTSAGVTLPSALAEAEGLAMCDGFFFAHRAYGLAQAIGLGQLRQVVPTLGSSYLPSNAFHSSFGPGVYAGTDQVRDVRFSDACGCFDYAGGAVGVSR